jgi:hypothetical protein
MTNYYLISITSIYVNLRADVLLFRVGSEPTGFSLGPACQGVRSKFAPIYSVPREENSTSSNFCFLKKRYFCRF